MNDKNYIDKKSFYYFVIIASVFCLFPILIGTLMYKNLPETLPTHFNFSGNIDKYSHKNTVVFYMPILMFFLTIIASIKTYYDPFNKNKSNINKKLFLIMILLIPLLSNMLFFVSVFYSTKNKNYIMLFLDLFLGIFFIIIGNYMPKNKQNATIGIRTSYTLKDEYIWNKSNKIGGYLFVICGILCIINSIFLFYNINFSKYIVIAIFLVITIPYIYSFFLYKKLNKNKIC